MRTLPIAIIITLLLHTGGSAQNCAPPPIVFNTRAENLFTPEQEMFLGDAMMERVEKDYRVIDDATVNEHVQALGDRIAKHLPASGLRFRFVVADTPYTNAYAFAGGRIMVTRKLISFVRSEDELAGVVAHELGHAVVHHVAIDMSRYFRELLRVTSVGDRKDVFEKYNRFLETFRTKRVSFSRNHQDDKQLEADRIGVFAMYAAGYDPSAMIAFWKRFTEAKKIGFFDTLFGRSTPADKRLEEMIAALKTIPPNCRDKFSTTRSADYEKWRSFVINYSGLGAKESLVGMIYRRELVPLRPEIEHLRFSPDGRHILAQDSSTITVLRREPLSVLFRVEVEDALPANFSSDSQTLVVYNRNLRVQKWNISDQKLIAIHEIALPAGGYWQTLISPDGNYIACYRYNADLVIYNAATGEEVFKEKDFFRPTEWEVYSLEQAQDLNDDSDSPVRMKFSPDGRYFLAARIPSSFQSARYNSDRAIAFDLSTKKTFSVGENIDNLLRASMDFIGPTKVIGQFGPDAKKAGIFAFPSGQRLDQFELAGKSFVAAHSGGYVTVRPVVGAAVGVYDLKQKKFLFGNAKPALDAFDNEIVAERRDGEVGIFNVETRANVASVGLPPSPFASIRASALSTDAHWIALSDRSRGAAWDLRTGARKTHVRAFRGVYIAPDAKAYTDFPRQGKTERSVAVMDLPNGSVSSLGDLITPHYVRQFGRYMMMMKPIKEPEKKVETEVEKKDRPYFEEPADKPVPRREVVLEMHDVRTGVSLWKREFRDERPGVAISSVYDTMLLAWALNSDEVKRRIKGDAVLRSKREKMGDKDGDLFIEFVDPKNGAVTGNLLLETGEGSFAPEYYTWAGEYLLINDDRNRILIFSITTGELIARFFGNYPAISPLTKQIAIENSPGRVTIFDVSTGKELARLSFVKPVSLMRFTDNGAQLFVLTSDQTAFSFDVMKFKDNE